MYLSYGDMLCLVFLIGLLWAGGIYLLLRTLDKWGFIRSDDPDNNN